MHGFRFCWLLFSAAWVLAGDAVAAEYRLLNGDTYQGEATGFDDYGLVFRLDIGGYTSRIGWGQLTQEALVQLRKNPQAAKLVEPFIDTPPAPKKQKQKKEIVLKEFLRLERPPKAGFFASLGSPTGLAIVLVLFLANLYAAYEVAVYRQRPALAVCGLSFVLPIVGPLLFLSLPSGEAAGEMLGEEDSAGPSSESLVSNPLSSGKKKTGPAPSSLGLAAMEKKKTEGGSLEGSVFKRGETTFNRRFFEATFAGFFRVVPSEAEKDLVLVVRAGKNEYIAKRISRISMGDMHVQVLRGGTEAQISFAEISEVLVRRKDAKG